MLQMLWNFFSKTRVQFQITVCVTWEWIYKYFSLF